MLQKYKKLILCVLLLIIAVIAGKYVYKKYKKYRYNLTQVQPGSIIPEIQTTLRAKLQYQEALKEASKIPALYWDGKYQDMQIKGQYKVAIVSHHGGEFSYAEFFKYAAEKIGWEVEIYYRGTLGHEVEILKFDPDFIMFTNHTDFELDPRIIGHRSKKYTLSLSPIESLRAGYKEEFPYFTISKEFEQLFIKTDGIFTAAQEIDIYQQMAKKINKSFNAIRILPLAPEMINTPAEPKNLMWYGMPWPHDLRGGDNYKKFITLLSENIPMKVYGYYHNYSYLGPNIYDGYIPSATDIIDVIRKNGIYLLTHSAQHIESKTPSLRIFEAVAANVVVISDKHPFAIEHFGDNFLYFDQDADAETMYKQVKAHYDWIKANPEKAEAMAARAHQIFLDKFTIEKDLSRIAKMHEYILKQDKEKNLSYPLVN